MRIDDNTRGFFKWLFTFNDDATIVKVIVIFAFTLIIFALSTPIVLLIFY